MKNLLALVLFSVVSSWAVECPAHKSGNWSNQETWGTLGIGCVGAANSGVPGIGDTITTEAFWVDGDVDTTIGTDGATGTKAVTVSAGGKLAIKQGVIFKSQGDVVSNRGSVTTVFGTLILDSRPGVNVSWTSGVTGAGTATMLVTGVPSQYAVVKKGLRGGTAQIIGGESITPKPYGDTLFTYARFEELGSQSLLAFSAYTGITGGRISGDHTLWANSGGVYGRATNGTQHVNWDHTTLIDPIYTGTDFGLLAFPVNTTGSRSFKNFFSWNSASTYAHVDISPVLDMEDVSNVVLYRTTFSVANNFARNTNYTGIFTMADVDGPSQLFSVGDNNGQSVTESIGFTHMNNPKVFIAGAPGIDYGVTKITHTVLDGDRYLLNDWGDGSGALYTNNIVIGAASNLITIWERTATSNTIRLNIYNNTVYQSYGNNFCETYCKPDGLQNYKNNLMVDMYGNAMSSGQPTKNVGRGFWQAGPMVSQNAANIDFNVWFQPSASNMLRPDNLVHPVHGLGYLGAATVKPYWTDGAVYGTVANRGLNDFKADPQFVDPARTIRKWVGVQLGVDTASQTFQQLAAEIFKESGWTKTGVPTLPLGLTTTSALKYMRAGFAPRNTALRGVGSDGKDIGAVAVVGVKNSLGATLQGGSTIF